MRVRSELGDGEELLQPCRPASRGHGPCLGTGAARERAEVGVFQREIQEAPEGGS